MIIIDKILIFISDYYRLPSNDYSIIDQQRIGWIFYLIDQSATKLDLCAIFLRLARILQPWFADSLSQMVIRMADNHNGTRKAVISEDKRDVLLRTITMFANPFENIDDNQITTSSSIESFPRNRLYQEELNLFRKRKMMQMVEICSVEQIPFF